MEKLPLELWRHVFTLLPWYNREPVTLVCRSFRWLAQPLLFENTEIRLLHEHREILPGRIEFLTSARISYAVKVCRLYAPTLYFTADDTLKDVALEALSSFHNLISLRLDGFTISPFLLNILFGFSHLAELELLHCQPPPPSVKPPVYRPLSIPYFKIYSVPITNDSLDPIAAALMHPLHAQSVVLGHRPYKFFRALLTANISYHIRALSLPPAAATSQDFSLVLAACPLLEDLRFRVERINAYEPSSFTYNFDRPPKTLLTRLRSFQGPWNMIEPFMRGRPVAHLVIWDFDVRRDGAGEMLAALEQAATCRLESLEIYTHTLTPELVETLARALTIVRALSFVVEMPQELEPVYASLASLLPSCLEYFACYTSVNPGSAAPRPLHDLFPLTQFPRLRYIYDGKPFNPFTGLTVDEEFIENWQRAELGLYTPFIDSYV